MHALEPMDCREFLNRYSDYDDSLISAGEADRFRAHMSECAACARYDRVLRKGRMLARQIPTPEPSPNFIPDLQRRLLRQARSRGIGVRGARLAAGLAAATVLMVAASAVQLLEQTPPSVAGSAELAPPVVSEPAVELVVRTAPPALPAAGSGVTRAWTARMVATAGGSSYSPLVTGPPTYRSRLPSFPGTADTDRRALD